MKPRNLAILLGAAVILSLAAVAGTYWLYRPPEEDISPQVADVPPVREAIPKESPWSLEEFHPYALRKGFPPITKFPTIAAKEAEGKVGDEESVLGVEVGGEARAYPIQMLTYVDNEIVNDTLGGTPIAATWCDRCQDAAVFSRVVDGRPLTFAITGKVWIDNMVMTDSETGSEWSQMLGRAMQGPEQGEELERLPAVVTDWKSWRTEHPETTVAILGRVPERVTQVERYRGKDGFVLGLATRAESRAWPLDALRAHPIVNDRFGDRPLLVSFDEATQTARLFERSIDGRELTFRRSDAAKGLVDEPTGSTWNPNTGRAIDGELKGKALKPVAGMVALRKVWNDFHPKGQTWSPAETK